MAESAAGKLYTLTEVSKLTNISMPTLQRYKKAYQDRIPSTGEGRRQRYPEEALKIFRELKTENVGRRGRPRKNASTASAKKAPARKTRARKAPAKQAEAGGEKLLTLMEVGKLTNISYPTLLRYVNNHLKDIPHTGSGRNRRYHPEAVAVFKKLRQESKTGRKAGSTKKAAPAKKRGPGRPRKAAAAKAAPAKKRGPGRPRKAAAAAAGGDVALAARVVDLEKANKKMAKDLARLEKLVQKPFRVTLARK